MKSVLTIVMLAALLAIPGFAAAQTGPGGGGGMGMHHGMGPGPGSWASNLNLTPDQMQKLQAIRINFFKETIAQRNQLDLARMELRALWSQPNPDANAIVAKQKQVNALRDQILEAAVRFRLEARKVFTPEQLAKIQARRAAFGYGFGRRHHGMGAGGCGHGMGMGMGMGHSGMGRGSGMGGKGCPCGSGQM